MRITKIFLLFILIAFTGCYSNRVTVQTKYFSNEDLASFYVKTPDPLQNNPPVGQSLLISWSLNQELCKYLLMEIRYTIRLKDKKEFTDSYPINRKKGYFTYSLYNDDYFKSGGIATYKVQLIGDGEVLEEWLHQLWQELIVF